MKFLYDCVTGSRIEGSYGCIMADEMVIIILVIDRVYYNHKIINNNDLYMHIGY